MRREGYALLVSSEFRGGGRPFGPPCSSATELSRTCELRQSTVEQVSKSIEEAQEDHLLGSTSGWSISWHLRSSLLSLFEMSICVATIASSLRHQSSLSVRSWSVCECPKLKVKGAGQVGASGRTPSPVSTPSLVSTLWRQRRNRGRGVNTGSRSPLLRILLEIIEYVLDFCYLAEMFRVKSMLYLTARIPQLGMISSQPPGLCFSTALTQTGEDVNKRIDDRTESDTETTSEKPIGWNITRKEKIKFLTKTLSSLNDSKEAVYGTLDSWVAWEQNFPIAALKNVLLTLEKEQQWHRVVHVTKWLLSKGQANTMGTYRQLIRGLDMDHRAEEAHQFWVRKIGHDLHPVPWQLCSLMISIYYRNNMFENLVKLFKRLEAFGRKPPQKSIVQKVVNAYEILGMVDEKERVMEKYSDLLSRTKKEEAGEKKKSKRSKSVKVKSSGVKMISTSTSTSSRASDDQSKAAE